LTYGKPNALLKRSNVKADRRLAHMERRLRTGKTPMLGNGQKYGKAFKISS